MVVTPAEFRRRHLRPAPLLLCPIAAPAPSREPTRRRRARAEPRARRRCDRAPPTSSCVRRSRRRQSACVIVTATLDSADVITRSAVHAPPHWRSHAAEAKTADRLRSRQSGRELNDESVGPASPGRAQRAMPPGDRGSRDHSRPPQAWAARPPPPAVPAPLALAFSRRRGPKRGDRHRSRQSGHLRARLPRAESPATERRSSRPALGPPDVMSCDDRAAVAGAPRLASSRPSCRSSHHRACSSEPARRRRASAAPRARRCCDRAPSASSCVRRSLCREARESS